MKNITQSLKVITLALILSIGISYVSAWTAPTATPPGGNVVAPLNVGTTDQIKGDKNLKTGSLGIGGLIRGYSNAIFDGSVGIGTAGNSTGLKLDVEGNVGAVQYCDNNGANCVVSSALGGGINWDNPVLYDFTSNRVGFVIVTTAPAKLCTLRYTYVEISGYCNMIKNTDNTWTLTSNSADNNKYIGCIAYCFN